MKSFRNNPSSKKYLFLIALFFNYAVVIAQIDNEDNFYLEVVNDNYNRDFVIDYNVDNDFLTDDSAKLQQAIDDISSNGGGMLTIRSGNYSFGEINLKSNVHLSIDASVVIRPFYEIPGDGKLKNYAIFKLGKNSNPIENVSISCSSSGRFKVDLTQNNNPNVAVINCVKVSNFKLSDIDVDDNYTKFSAVTSGGDYYNSVYTFPTNGIVKNIDVNNAHYGYGTVQTQSAENILFKNLSGTGGATLRLETGFTGLNNLQGTNLPAGKTRVGGLNSIVGRNISSINGNCAVMVSPHAVHNGWVDIEGVTALSSGFAVRVEAGFISNKYDQTIGLTDGTFENVNIKDVSSTYGESAEVKAKHFKYYPPEIENPTTEAHYLVDGETRVYVGASIAPVLVDCNFTCTSGVQTVVVEEPIIGIGYNYQDNIIPVAFLSVKCATLSIKEEAIKTQFRLFPNPASEFIFIKNESLISNVEIYNLTGKLMKNKGKFNESEVKLDVSKFPSGLYIVKVFFDDKFTTKKMLKI